MKIKIVLNEVKIINEFLDRWEVKANNYYNSVLKFYEVIDRVHSSSINEWNDRFQHAKAEQDIINEDHEKTYRCIERFKMIHNKLFMIIWGKSPLDWKEVVKKAVHKEAE